MCQVVSLCKDLSTKTGCILIKSRKKNTYVQGLIYRTSWTTEEFPASPSWELGKSKDMWTTQQK